MTSAAIRDELSLGRLTRLMTVLFLAGVAMRLSILAMPPVVPQVHRELGMSETQVGLLIGLPLLVFALAAIPGSLLIARIGASLAAIVGMTIAGLAGALRGAAVDVPTLYAATVATGFGVAIMQPGLPTLVRQWVPERIALGTIAYTCGMLVGTLCATGLTIPLVLPLIGDSWRRDMVFWAVPALAIVPVFYALSPATGGRAASAGKVTQWWPNFKDPLVWLLGLTFGSNNSPFFTTNAFLGDYLTSLGKPDQLGPALGWLNGAQMVAPLVLLVMSSRLQRRAWPFLLFGPVLLLAFLGLILVPSTGVILACAGAVGFTTAITLTATLALPPALCSAAELPRTSAGMFTISYATAIIVPTISGALWDATGKPWTAFLPLCLCAATLTLLGTAAARFRPRGEAVFGR